MSKCCTKNNGMSNIGGLVRKVGPQRRPEVYMLDGGSFSASAQHPYLVATLLL